jgi:hypothetical protein
MQQALVWVPYPETAFLQSERTVTFRMRYSYPEEYRHGT